MSYEKLTSDKVNYLIWRYLQEAGFGQTAARLQLDWGLQHHPDDLSFAKHIGPRSLIKLMHYGLKLHRIQTTDKPNASRFFGPDPDSMAITETVATTTTTTTSIFRPKSSSPSRRLEISNQASASAPSSTSKPRNRRINGNTTGTNGKPKGIGESMDVDQSGATTDITQDVEMDIDDNDAQKRGAADEQISAVPSPVRNGELQQSLTNGMDHHVSVHQNQEQQSIPSPLPVPTLTNGTSIGVQSDKVIELAPMTTVLDNSTIKGNNLSHAKWCPSNTKTFSRSLLAIGGKQLGQIWEINKVDESGNIDQATITSATSDQNLPGSISDQHPHNVVRLDVGSGHTLVSLAWSPDGDRLAYSMFSDHIGGPQRSVVRTRLRLTGEDGDTFSTVSDAVTNLAWNETGRFIAGISSASLLILDTKSGTQFRPIDVEHTLFDMTWIDKETLAICGSSYIAIASVSGLNINVSHVFTEIAGSTEWTIIRYDAQLNNIAVASETAGDFAIIQSNLRYHKETRAHNSSIVDMAYQPASHAGIDQPRILVTSSIDGSVKMWNTRSGIMLEQALVMGGITQALSLAFSPDGNLLAVADWDKVLFWDIRQSIQPKYKWELRRVNWQTLPNGHTSNGVNHVHDIPMEETDEEAPILAWNGPGQCLTFAHKDKVAMINIPT